MSELGRYFKKKREMANLTQAEVAKAIGMGSLQQLSNVERGVVRVPLKYIRPLCRIIGADPKAVSRRLLSEYKRRVDDEVFLK